MKTIHIASNLRFAQQILRQAVASRKEWIARKQHLQNTSNHLIISILLLSGIGLGQIQAQTLYVAHTSGWQFTFPISDIHKITFVNGIINILQMDSSLAEFSPTYTRHLSFKDYIAIPELPYLPENQLFTVYPNPFHEHLNLDLQGNKSYQGSIAILSLDRKLVLEQRTQGMSTVELNLSQLPPGIFLCRYTNGTESKTLKIIKQ